MRGVLLGPDATRLSWRLFSSLEAFVNHKLYCGLESTIGELLAYCRKRGDVRIKRRFERETR
jgi:hypothetical protein